MDNSLYKCPVFELFRESQWLSIIKRYNMTPREAEVANMILKGFSYDKVSKRLEIQPGTVKVHLRTIYGKVQVKNKSALLLKFMDYVNRASTNPSV